MAVYRCSCCNKKMKYWSTRCKTKEYTFRDAVFMAYTQDGGLLVPAEIPSISTEILLKWSSYSYVQLVESVLQLFISEEELPKETLKCLVKKGLSRFPNSDVVTLAHLGGGLNILELFHGPSLVFKDLSLSIMAELMNYFLERDDTWATILVGTSGDTGGAAIEAIKNLDSIDIVVFLPHGRCTKTQELHMTTAVADNVHVFAVDGDNDEIQVPITESLNDQQFVHDHRLGSLNSINWVRVLVQCVHYFYVYFQMAQDIGDVVEIVVPVGGGGHLAGGVVAYKMGLPIKLVAVNNSNDLAHRVISLGHYSQKKVQTTMAVSMDIQDMYNLERLLYFVSDGDSLAVDEVMKCYETQGHAAVIPDYLLEKLQNVMTSHAVNDNDHIIDTMQRCYRENKYLICPHTATCVHYHYVQSQRLKRDPLPGDIPRVCFATASPEKFPEMIRRAGLRPRGHPTIDRLPTLPTRSTPLGRDCDWAKVLHQTIEKISEKRSK